jgi:hypothetical protein
MSMPSIRLAVAAAIALATSVAPAAQASTHRFAAAPEVTVRFEIRSKHISGTLVRFVRNRLSVVRSRNGKLTIRARGRHSRPIRARRRGPVGVVVTVASSSARLRAGGPAAVLAGPFVSENTVRTRPGRAIARVRVTTRRRSDAAPAATPLGAPPPAMSPAQDVGASATGSPGGRPTLFAADSVWNAPLPADALLDPRSDVLVKTLNDTVAHDIAARWGPWISTFETSPLYTVPADQPTVRVRLSPGSWKVGLQQTFEAVPIPPEAEPALGPDAHLTVWQPSTDRLWELYHASKQADGWHADFGGSIASVSRSPGYFTTDSWPGLSKPSWGATATSLPVIAGTMMIDELEAGVIPHALAMNIPYALPNVYSWPAQRTDGDSTDPDAIPEGARFRLDPDLDLSSLELPPLTRMIAVAAQRYGMIVRDQTHHAVSVFAENPAQFGTDPYTGEFGFYGGQWPNSVMEAFPWNHLQLVSMDLHTLG